MPDFSLFDRYRPLIDDWPAFTDALCRPLPTCVWANPLRTTPEALAGRLRESDVEAEPLPWYPGAFRLPDDVQAGKRLEYVTGHYHVQEEVSLLPVMLMAPQPGDRVLDLCAAPGNKTAQLGVALGNRGTVVANDRNAGRLYALHDTVDRLGLLNVSVTVHDGTNLPAEAGPFDHVLVDVPCSCEGTSRKHPAVLDAGPDARPGSLAGVQRALLRKAAALCRPGGRVVYSTCTYAPEENEQVVDDVLKALPDMLRVLPADIDGLETSPGLTSWNGRSYHSGLRHAVRLWPHHNDTGGFFVAVLERTHDTP